MLKKIDHVNIVVADIGRAKEFYIALGFAVRDESDLSGEWISSIVGLTDVEATYAALELPGAETTLELIQYYHPAGVELEESRVPNTAGIRHLAFEVNDIELVVSTLKSLGAEVVGDICEYPKTGKKLVYFYGPGEVLLELAEYPKSN